MMETCPMTNYCLTNELQSVDVIDIIRAFAFAMQNGRLAFK